jgi:hypothetical protein
VGKSRMPLGAAVIKQMPHKCQYSYFSNLVAKDIGIRKARH